MLMERVALVKFDNSIIFALSGIQNNLNLYNKKKYLFQIVKNSQSTLKKIKVAIILLFLYISLSRCNE